MLNTISSKENKRMHSALRAVVKGRTHDLPMAEQQAPGGRIEALVHPVQTRSGFIAALWMHLRYRKVRGMTRVRVFARAVASNTVRACVERRVDRKIVRLAAALAGAKGEG